MNEINVIQQFIVDNIDQYPRDIVLRCMNHFAISRTTVLRHIQHLIKQKVIFKTGETKNMSYYKTNVLSGKVSLKLTEAQDEFTIVKKYFGALTKLKKNISDICDYGLTEMINNVIDHSKGKFFTIEINEKDNNINLTVKDDGIGIFKKISQVLNASDKREAILQLNKGKFTTDPSNHSGEGIFFCSRIFDEYILIANGLKFIRNNIEHDWFIEELKTSPGTTVIMSLSLNSERNLSSTFKKFTDPDSYNFNGTEIIVALSKFGDEKYIARSQAKRILKNLEFFEKITLDFMGINTVGQGFVDEVFRVFQNRHPNIIIDYINANENVTFMVKRGLSYK